MNRENALQSQAQNKANFKQALDIFNKRKTGNTYVPKKQNIFMSWRNYINEEKNAVNIIGAIAR
jgi:hypothetical protein